jgi:hypothetical protein
VARGELTDDEWAFIAPFLPMGRNGPYPERLVAVRRRAALPVDCQRADFGALKVPSLPGAESHPLRAGDRVVVVFGGHALGLQAYRTHDAPVWDSVRPKVIEQIRTQGGRAENGESRFGAEVLAEVPVVRDGQRVPQPTRVIGCDGPGRLLRGVLAGPTALSAAIDPRALRLIPGSGHRVSRHE